MRSATPLRAGSQGSKQLRHAQVCRALRDRPRALGSGTTPLVPQACAHRPCPRIGVLGQAEYAVGSSWLGQLASWRVTRTERAAFPGAARGPWR